MDLTVFGHKQRAQDRSRRLPLRSCALSSCFRSVQPFTDHHINIPDFDLNGASVHHRDPLYKLVGNRIIVFREAHRLLIQPRLHLPLPGGPEVPLAFVFFKSPHLIQNILLSGSFRILLNPLRQFDAAPEVEMYTGAGFRCDLLHQTSEQGFIEALQAVRPAVDFIDRLTEGVQRFLQVILLQQAAALLPKLRQTAIEFPQLGGPGGGVQKALALEGADLIALVGRLGDGLVYRQHGGIVPLAGLVQSVQLAQGGLEDDAVVEPELVVHPCEGGVNCFLRDRPHGAGGGVSQVIPAAPDGGTLPGSSPVEGLSASLAVHFPGQRVDAVRAVPALLFPLPESLNLLKGLPADDGGMGALDVDLVHLAVIDLLREGKAGFIGFLAERVADVFFVR